MDEGLFKKHIQHILARARIKQKIILTIQEKTGIEIKEEEITIFKKTIILSVSSVKKAALLQKGIRELLTALGYTLQA